ncbi:MAG: peptidyl-prolyl cis-trans isomerase [Fervidobacterium sp.]|uniref:SurA N-terminal domain-containing protein n=1 Tax=Fervidobacterium gondwanense DSM 13020 TaxID=1121883 RepID=A0A1M7RUL7_FERGO|nr:peptidyl-prolyl cis-trans isomerase [Fervidobacterium gondwanense]UXF01909.1 hypothetical protein IB67_10475 [Fervidobacterium riparium]SHN49904.1 SurA N-terminal domain-containing protein [Fervidobacterium gondwanense DSM 13020]
MKKLLLVVVFTTIVLSSISLAQQDVVAIVNGRNVTMDEWNREANIQKLLMEIQSSNEIFYSVLTTSQEGLVLLERYKLKVLDTLIKKILFIQFAESLKVQPDEKTVKADVENEIKKLLTDLKMTEQQFNDYLMQFGMGTLSDYRQKLYFQRTYALSLANVYALYLKDIAVTDDEIKAYYDKNKDKYTVSTQYDLVVFKTKDKALADSIRQELVKKTAVEEISKKYNITVTVNGMVSQNDTTKLPQALWIYVNSAIKGTALPVQQVSGEYYVIQVRDIKVGGTKSLDQVKEEIKNALLSQKQEQAKQKVLTDFDAFSKKAKIDILYKSSIVKN